MHLPAPRHARAPATTTHLKWPQLQLLCYGSQEAAVRIRAAPRPCPPNSMLRPGHYHTLKVASVKANVLRFSGGRRPLEGHTWPCSLYMHLEVHKKTAAPPCHYKPGYTPNTLLMMFSGFLTTLPHASICTCCIEGATMLLANTAKAVCPT